MKQSDIITVSLIGVVGVVIAFLVCNAILPDPTAKPQKIETVEVVEKGVQPVDAETFNVMANNPTVEVYVGESKQANGTQDSGE